MADLGSFDAEQQEPNIPFEAIPAGWYEAMIVESDMEETKAKDGKFLKLKLQIVGGTYEGRTLFDRLNLDNPNPVAVQIARGTLSSICRAVNVLKVRDSSELHNLPLMVKVAQKLFEGELRNEIKGYKAREGAANAAPVTAGGSKPVVAAASPAPAGSGAAPWAKKATG